MKTMSKRKLYGISLLATTGIIGLVCTLALTSQNLGAFVAQGQNNEYHVRLDSTNAYSGSDQDIITSSGSWHIGFHYTNAAAKSNYHVTLNDGGTLVNKNLFKSLTSFNATFDGSGTLKARFSYDGATWGGYTTLKSGETITLGSNPYYAELSATGTVNIATATYEYSCVENPAAEIVPETTYNLVKSTSELKAGDEIIIAGTKDSGSNWYALRNATLSQAWYLAANSITIADDKANVTSSHDVWTVGTSGTDFTFKSGDNYFLITKSGSHYNLGLSTTLNDTCRITVSFNSSYYATLYSSEAYATFDIYGTNPATPEFKGYSATQNNIKIFKKVTTGPEAPVTEIGFSATDANANSYTINSVYATDNALVVKALFDDNTSKVLTNEYSYNITKQGSSTPINVNEPFGETGIYTLTVNYGNHVPTVINLNVGAALTAIAVNTTKLSYFTNDKLSDHLDKVSVDLSYSDSSLDVENIPYSSFSEYNLSLSLINPNNVTAATSVAFGTTGNWTIKVESLSNSAIYGLLAIDVKAVPVTNITMSDTEISVQEEQTHQLTASVTPDYATDTSVAWRTSDANVATVSETGLVTGVKEGTATIYATANGGTNVVGSCAVTVTPKPAQSDFDASMTAGSNSEEGSLTVSGKTYSGVKVGSSKNSGSMTITVGKGAVSMSFYAVGWGGTNTTISLSTKEDITFGTESVDAKGDSGASGNAPYTLANNEEDCFITVNLFNVTSETTITLTASKRFIVWNATYSINTTPVVPVYPTSVSLSGSSKVSIDSATQLEVSYSPADTNIKEVTFESSNTNVATVSQTGVVTGLSVGNATITVTANAGNDTFVNDTFDISVEAIAVTSVSLNKSSLTLTVDGSETLTATVNPSNATNKNVTWTSSDSAVASVVNGTVTALKAGSTTITVKTVDGNKTATCAVTVTESGSSGGGEGVTQTATILTSDAPRAYDKTDTIHKIGEFDYVMKSVACFTSGRIQWKSNEGYIYNSTPIDGISKITIGEPNSGTFSGTIYTGDSENPSSNAQSIAGGASVSITGGPSYFKIKANTVSGGAMSGDITIEYSNTPIAATNITSLSKTSVDLSVGQSETLTPTYYPTNANTGLEVNWTSNNSNITVSSTGKVTVFSTASIGETATITCTLASNASVKKTCTVTVIQKQLAAWTIMLYLCGSDLESGNGFATSDINEILSVSGQPTDVNFIIETGGSNSWSKSGISSSKLGRWHVNNKQLVKDTELDYSYMGSQSTLESFINFGYENYEAQKMGLIFWNHGGAMEGVCYDQKHSSEDTLKNNEVKGALENTLGSNKLEFIGYDACLMQVQEIAEFNSPYANYMIASQESEAGEGWDYDTWLDDLYAKKDTKTILKAIVDGFITDNGGVNGTGGYDEYYRYYPCNQTLSYLDLSYMSAYKTAWENMAVQLSSKISAGGKSGFNTNVMGKVKYFGDTDWKRFGSFDAKHFLQVLSNNPTYNPGSTYINAVTSAFNNLVAYSVSQTEAAHDAHGLCFNYYCGDTDFWGSSTKNYFSSTYSNFTNWCSLAKTYGGSFSSSYRY